MRKIPLHHRSYTLLCSTFEKNASKKTLCCNFACLIEIKVVLYGRSPCKYKFYLVDCNSSCVQTVNQIHTVRTEYLSNTTDEYFITGTEFKTPERISSRICTTFNLSNSICSIHSSDHWFLDYFYTSCDHKKCITA